MDIKLPKNRYPLVFNSPLSVDAIEESIKILKNSHLEFEFRTTVAPGIHTIDDLEKMARWIGQEIPGRKPRYFLQNFRPGKILIPILKSSAISRGIFSNRSPTYSTLCRCIRHSLVYIVRGGN